MSGAPQSRGAHLDGPVIPSFASKLGSLLSILIVFGKPHRRWLASGALAAALVIACRLSLPLLAKVALAHWIGGHGHRAAMTAAVAERLGGDPFFLAVLACLLISVVLGFADHLERLWFARFAAALAKDLRGRALVRAAGAGAPRGRKARADLISRFVADLPKIKSGLKGILVHVAKGGLLLIGVIVVLLWTSPALAGIFAAACGVLGLVTALSAARTYELSSRRRVKAGKLTSKIDKLLRDPRDEDLLSRLSRPASRCSAGVTRALGHATMAAHAIFGLSIAAGLLIGDLLVTRGALRAEDVVVFVLYAFMTRRPMVQLARQGARTGTILALVNRLDEVLARDTSEAPRPAVAEPRAGELTAPAEASR